MKLTQSQHKKQNDLHASQVIERFQKVDDNVALFFREHLQQALGRLLFPFQSLRPRLQGRFELPVPDQHLRPILMNDLNVAGRLHPRLAIDLHRNGFIACDDNLNVSALGDPMVLQSNDS